MASETGRGPGGPLWPARSGYDDDTVGAAPGWPRHLRGYPKNVSHDAPIRKRHLSRVGSIARARVAASPTGDMRSPVRGAESPRGKYWWARWVILGIVGIVLAVEIALGWRQLAKAWMSLYEANWWWLLAAVLAAAASMHSFAQIQRTHQYLPRVLSPPRAGARTSPAGPAGPVGPAGEAPTPARGNVPKRGRWSLRTGASCDTCLA